MPANAQPFLFPGNETGSSLYAEVIVPIAVPQNFTWSVPEEWREQIGVGKRVEVNLGNRRRYAGIVKTLHTQKPVGFHPKPILQVLDDEPIVSQQQLDFWTWIAQYYLCTEGEVMAAALPTNFKLSSETWVRYRSDHSLDLTTLDDPEFLLAEALSVKKQLRIAEVQLVLQNRKVLSTIDRLAALGIAELVDSLQEKYTNKEEVFIELAPVYRSEKTLQELLNGKWRSAKQLELLLLFLDNNPTGDPIERSSFIKKHSVSTAIVQALVEKGILVVSYQKVDRIVRADSFIEVGFSLSAQQQQALASVTAAWNDKDVCLLKGVTGSGKTHIYIELIADALRKGKQVLYLLPEIALTGQIIRRLQKHFGGSVGVYHSKFSSNERVEIWKDVLSGKIRVLLGARSSLFLPFTDLGLIICDEEHDASYKQQDPAPRYHARDAAIYLATQQGAKILLGSATPSLETYYQSEQGKYGLVELTERFGTGVLPSLRFIDTRAILKEDRTRVSLSPLLIKKMTAVLDRKRQIILFQNRRGYSPYQICTVCGWIPRCQHCDVSLTYHKKNNQLRCHYCGTQYPLVSRCISCGNHRFGQRSFGTERIEEQIQQYFPKSKVARMDVDTVRGKEAHDKLIRQFESGEVDILVGTQMVVKGLDFDRVDLVGILDADGLLHFADFRANERAFQLMEQVSGRAGRKDAGGEVIVQTSEPNHPILAQVAQHDYAAFYSSELKKRSDFGYPPFFRLVRILFRHKDAGIVQLASIEWMKAMGEKWKSFLLGPSEPLIARVRDQYRMEAWLRLPRSSAGWQEAKRKIIHASEEIKKNKLLARVDIVLDVDHVG
ncbi:MAG: primosomal protein N' [Bacteroidota bacterium]